MALNYEKCNYSKKIDKQKFFYIFFYIQCCITINKHLNNENIF